MIWEVPRLERLHSGHGGFSLVAAVGEAAFDEREDSPSGVRVGRHHDLVAGRVNDDFLRQTERVEQDVSLLGFDLLANAVARSLELHPTSSQTAPAYSAQLVSSGTISTGYLSAHRLQRGAGQSDDAVVSLHAPEPGEGAAAALQLKGRAVLDHLAVGDHQDAVHVGQGRQTVGDG